MTTVKSRAPDIAFLHTAAVHVPTFGTLLVQQRADVQAVHLVDESLLAQARAVGADDPGVVRAVQAAVQEAARNSGARLVVCTCSTVGGAAERTPTDGSFAALRIDRAMADRAALRGPAVLLVAALASTLEPTSALLLDSAQRLQRPLQITPLLVAGAWPRFEAGDTAGYLEAVVAAVTQAVRDAQPRPGAVVLAQASMAPAVELLADIAARGIDVLASPRLGVSAALERLESMSPR